MKSSRAESPHRKNCTEMGPNQPKHQNAKFVPSLVSSIETDDDYNLCQKPNPHHATILRNKYNYRM